MIGHKMKLLVLIATTTLAVVFGQQRWINSGGMEEIREIEYGPLGQELIIDKKIAPNGAEKVVEEEIGPRGQKRIMEEDINSRGQELIIDNITDYSLGFIIS